MTPHHIVSRIDRPAVIKVARDAGGRHREIDRTVNDIVGERKCVACWNGAERQIANAAIQRSGIINNRVGSGRDRSQICDIQRAAVNGQTIRNGDVQQIALSHVRYRIQIHIEIRSGFERQRANAECAKCNARPNVAATVHGNAARHAADAAKRAARVNRDRAGSRAASGGVVRKQLAGVDRRATAVGVARRRAERESSGAVFGEAAAQRLRR